MVEYVYIIVEVAKEYTVFSGSDNASQLGRFKCTLFMDLGMS